MRLTLKVLTYCDQQATDSRVRTFDKFPVILGRSTACGYCLNDPSQYVSSNHAVVMLEGEQLLIRDTSSNGVYVNGYVDPIGRERTMALTDNDTLAIGDYILQVTIDRSDANATDDSLNVGGAPGKAISDNYDPFKGDEPDWESPSTQDNNAELDDWGFDDTPVHKKTNASESPASDWADWPSDFAQTPVPEPRPASSRSADASRQKNFEANPRHAAKSVYPPRREPQNEHPTPARRPSTPNRQKIPSARHPPVSSVTTNELGVLLRAASLSESEFSHMDSTAVLEQSGRLLAQMVDAMMALLNSRAELKNYIRSDTTQLAKSDNNPLKFSMSSADALSKLLANNTDGYLQSDQAVQQAVEDLKLHQLAMLEGMKLAVRSVLLKFDPEKLAKDLETTGGLAANIPVTRDAKLWEIFCEQYGAIREEAVNDFEELFGEEFRKTYEKHARKKGRQSEF